MGQFGGDYSRPYPGMYDAEKRYIGILPQRSQGATKRPVVDSDLMDHLLSQTHMLRTFMEEVLGSGAPGDGFSVSEASATVNNFELKAGSFYNNGLRASISDDTDYISDGSHPNDIHAVSTGLTETELTDTAANWVVNELVGRKLVPDANTPGNSYTISANTATKITVQGGDTMITDGATAGCNYYATLTTPSGADRTDTVYLDCYLDEVDKDEDGNLLHDINGAIYETCNRLKIRQVVKVVEGSTTIPTDGDDSDGNKHWYYKLAEINRLDGNANITTAMIDDWRLDIKRALWQVPDLDVGGGYNDVVDGGLSVDQEGNLETDGRGIFDGGLKVETAFEYGYNTATTNPILMTFGTGIVGLPEFGSNVSDVQGTIGKKVFEFNKGIKIEAVDDDGNIDDSFLSITARNQDKIAGIIFAAQNAVDVAAPKVYVDGSDAPNKLMFEIIQISGAMADDPIYHFTSDQATTEMYLDGISKARDRFVLNPDSLAQPAYVTFDSEGLGTEVPKIGYGVSGDEFTINRSIEIDLTDSDGSVAEMSLKAMDDTGYRRSRIKLDVPNLDGDRALFNLELGINSVKPGSPWGDRYNAVFFSIDSTACAASGYPDTFTFSSDVASPEDTLLEVVGGIDAWYGKLVIGKEENIKGSAESYIGFYDDHEVATAGGRIFFDGPNNRFDINDDIRLYKGGRNEDTYLSVEGKADYDNFLELIGKSGGVQSATNRFRIHTSEIVTLGGSNAEPNYVTFTTRWDNADFNGAGATTRAIFRFQNRDNSDTRRPGMSLISVDGHYEQLGNYLTIGKTDGASPEAFIVFGSWNMSTQLPTDARMYLQANKSGFRDWLTLGNNGGLAGDRGLDIDGHLLMNELTSAATNTIPAGKVTMWISDQGKIYVKLSSGQTFEFVGSSV